MMAQESFATSPAIRGAFSDSMISHALTLEGDITAAMESRGITPDGWSARSLALHIQAVLQGAFVVAKAANDPALARDSIDHLRRYLGRVLGGPAAQRSAAA